MLCPQCRYENLPDAVFCESCGTKLGHICPQCQADNRVPSKFCRNCGVSLTHRSLAPRLSLLEKPQDASASQPTQTASPLTEQRIPGPERSQSPEIIYPRCGALRVGRRKVVVCVCLCNGDDQAHTEIRTFRTQTWGLRAASDWLVAQGVTHVAIASRGVHWLRVYRLLEHAFTVRLNSEVKDVEVMVDLLARGQLQGNSTPPQPHRFLSQRHRPTLVAGVTVLGAVLLATYWMWWHPSDMHAERPPLVPPSQAVQQPRQISYQYPAGEPFELALPPLEHRPQGMPVVVSLETPGEELSWLQFDREQLRIRGTPPLTAAGQTYRLMVRAPTEQGSDSRLVVSLTISGQSDRMTPTPRFPGHWTW